MARQQCHLCEQKGVIVLADGNLVCYAHYNQRVAEAVTTGQKVEATAIRKPR